MGFNPNVPNASQSPGLFPAQNTANMTRLKTIIQRDHVFNNNAASSDGIHKQVTLRNRSHPSSLPSGSNSMFYSRNSSDDRPDLWFYDDVSSQQVNWRQRSGTVTVESGNYSTITTLPGNCYGDVYLFRQIGNGYFISVGAFASTGTLACGYSYAQKFRSQSGTSEILRLGFDGNGASGLQLRVINDSGGTYNGVWNYRVFFRYI